MKEPPFPFRSALANALIHARFSLPSLLLYTRFDPFVRRMPGQYKWDARWSAILANVLIAVPTCWFTQAYAPFAFGRWWVPKWPIDVAFRLEVVTDNYIRRRTAYMKWLPPDSGDPHEVGIWYNTAALHGAGERPRAFWYTGTGDTATAAP